MAGDNVSQQPSEHNNQVPNYTSPRVPLQYSQAPVYAPQQFVQQPLVQQVPQQTSHVGTTVHQSAPVRGESRIEYVPYEVSHIEYEQVQRVEVIPHERRVTEYQVVEHQTEYIPHVYQDRYVDYIPQERVWTEYVANERQEQRVEYQAVTRQVVHQQPQQVVEQPVQYVQQPVQYVQQPVQQSWVQPVQQPIQQSVVHYQPQVVQQQPIVHHQPVVQQQPIVHHQPVLQQSFVRPVAPLTHSGVRVLPYVQQQPIEPNHKNAPTVVQPKPVATKKEDEEGWNPFKIFN